MPTLFDPVTLGRYRLPNRLVMAPMTRNRATPDGFPTASTAVYYAQRASAGLIVSEGTQPSLAGQGYPNTPGLHSEAHADAWKAVTDAVHQAGGHIFAQLMHAGRIGHPEVAGAIPIAPSAVTPNVEVWTASGQVDPVEPHAASLDEIPSLIQDYVDAAQFAMQAGFDGVELHGANGYLIQQFLSTNANLRTDQYGATIEGRGRFAVEVAAATADAIGADRVGIRFSPCGRFNDIVETESRELYAALMRQLAPLDLAYVHILETGTPEVNAAIRENWPGTLIVNPAVVDGSHQANQADGERWLAEGADLVSYGRAFISNPDLVERFRVGAPLAEPDRRTFYTPGDAGYIDYPTLEGVAGD